MRVTTRRLAMSAATASLIVPTALAGGQAQAAKAAPSAPAAAQCGAGATITKKLPGGTTWRMCWSHHNVGGLMLTGVTYQPKHESQPIPVLASARLAQINVPYDSGSVEYNDLTEMEFGSGLLPLAARDCPGGTIKPIRVYGESVNGLCLTTQNRGFAYHGNSGDVGDETGRVDSAQGQDLVIYTLTAVGYYQYVTQWNFSDDGTITAKAGATGNLSPGDYDASDGTGWPIGKGSAAKATSHHHNIFWRLKFYDQTGSPSIEQYDTRQTGVSQDGVPVLKTTRKAITTELAGDAANSRWWRVVSRSGRNGDGHRRSWELVQQHTDTYQPHDWTRNDVYFTQYRACEKYASDNTMFDRNCKDNVRDMVNGEALTNPVVWMNVGFHHIARDEDQTPMPMHWQGFQVVPRDVTAMSPLTPEHLHKPQYNGAPRW